MEPLTRTLLTQVAEESVRLARHNRDRALIEFAAALRTLARHCENEAWEIEVSRSDP